MIQPNLVEKKYVMDTEDAVEHVQAVQLQFSTFCLPLIC